MPPEAIRRVAPLPQDSIPEVATPDGVSTEQAAATAYLARNGFWAAMRSLSFGLFGSPSLPAANDPPALNPAQTRLVSDRRAGWPADMAERLSIAPATANGGRPVAVWVPPGFDPSRPAKLVTHLHGHHWNVGQSLASHGVLDAIRAQGEADPQRIFVFPEAGRVPFNDWMRAPSESWRGLETHALLAAATVAGGPISVGQRIVNAHSGGGKGLANAIGSGQFAADKVNLLDSTYVDWGLRAVQWAIAERQAGHSVRVESFYTRHMEMEAHNRIMRGAARARGMSDALVTHDVTGRPNPRPGPTRPRRLDHNSLVAAYLGVD